MSAHRSRTLASRISKSAFTKSPPVSACVSEHRMNETHKVEHERRAEVIMQMEDCQLLQDFEVFSDKRILVFHHVICTDGWN